MKAYMNKACSFLLSFIMLMSLIPTDSQAAVKAKKGREEVVLTEVVNPESRTHIRSIGDIHTAASSENPTLYKYKIPRGAKEIKLKAHIRYYCDDKSKVRQGWYAATFYYDMVPNEKAAGKWISGSGIKNRDLGGIADNPGQIFDAEREAVLKVPKRAEYFYVCARKKPLVTCKKLFYGENELVLEEEPTAGAIYEGEQLSASPIKLGKVVYNGREVEGNFVWENAHQSPTVNEASLKTFEAKFVPSEDIAGSQPLEIELKLPVYKRRPKSSFSSFVWRTGDGDLVPEKYVDKHPDLHRAFALGSVFNSFASLTNVTDEEAATEAARALMQQPKGRRAISIDGYLEKLMGGCTLAGDDIVMEKNEKADEEEEKDRLRKLRKYKDELYSKSGDKVEGYLFYDAPMRDDSMSHLGIKKGESGCQVIKRRLSNIFRILKSKDIEIDYVYGDIEGIEDAALSLRNRHRLEVVDTYLSNGVSCKEQWNKIWSNPRFKEEIYPELMERGFEPVEGEPLKDVKDANNFTKLKAAPNYGLNPKNYVKRRNVNIWDAVMKNYTQSLFNKYVMKPVTESYPDVKFSSWNNKNTEGWHNYATDFETYLGGSTKIDKDAYSCPPIYGKNFSFKRNKLSMDNWYTTIDSKTAFNAMQGDIGYTRNCKLAGTGRIQPFFCSKYYWTGDSKMRSYGYYEEMLIHAFMCRPDEMIAYLNHNDLNKFPAGYQLAKEEFLKNSCETIQDVLDELNEVIGTGDEKKPILKEIVTETDRFLLSGMKTAAGNIWRITPDIYRGETEDQSMLSKFYIGDMGSPNISSDRGSAFKIKGKTVAFPGGSLIEPTGHKSPFGYWVKTDAEVEPVVVSDFNVYEVNAALYDDFESYDVGTHPEYLDGNSDTPESSYFAVEKDGANKVMAADGGALEYYKLKNFTVMGEWAKNQVWEVKIKFDKKPSNEGIKVLSNSGWTKALKISGSDVLYGSQGGAYEKINTEDLKPGEWYKFKRVTDFDYGGKIRTSIYIYADERLIGKREGEKLGDSKPAENGAVTDSIILLKKEDKRTYRVCADDFKLYPAGKNVRADIFRISDGVNVSRANNLPLKKGERLLAKLTWLNALSEDIDYELKVEQYAEDGSLIHAENAISATAAHGDEGYELKKIAPLADGTEKIKVTIKDSQGSISESEIYVTPKNYIAKLRVQLKSLIEEGKAKKEYDYTQPSYSKLIKAIQKAEAVLKDENAAANLLISNIGSMRAALKNLVKVNQQDIQKLRRTLKNLIIQAKARSHIRYTPLSYGRLEAAVMTANNILAKKQAAEGELKYAAVKLRSALKGLIEDRPRYVLFNKLARAVKYGERKKPGNYEYKSYLKLRRALVHGRRVFKNSKSTNKEAIGATRWIYRAIDDLRLKYSIGRPSHLRLRAVRKGILISWRRVYRESRYEIERIRFIGKYRKQKVRIRVDRPYSGKNIAFYTDRSVIKRRATYYYRIRAYRVVDGKLYFGGYTEQKAIRSR